MKANNPTIVAFLLGDLTGRSIILLGAFTPHVLIDFVEGPPQVSYITTRSCCFLWGLNTNHTMATVFAFQNAFRDGPALEFAMKTFISVGTMTRRALNTEIV
jgi:hypothetical protein